MHHPLAPSPFCLRQCGGVTPMPDAATAAARSRHGTDTEIPQMSSRRSPPRTGRPARCPSPPSGRSSLRASPPSGRPGSRWTVSPSGTSGPVLPSANMHRANPRPRPTRNPNPKPRPWSRSTSSPGGSPTASSSPFKGCWAGRFKVWTT